MGRSPIVKRKKYFYVEELNRRFDCKLLIVDDLTSRRNDCRRVDCRRFDMVSIVLNKTKKFPTGVANFVPLFRQFLSASRYKAATRGPWPYQLSCRLCRCCYQLNKGSIKR